MALVCYVVVAASGVANLWTRLSWAELVESGTYAVLLLLKVTGFLALGLLRPRPSTSDAAPVVCR